jgi:hypothetical protein
MFEAGRWQTPEAGMALAVVLRLGRIETPKHRASKCMGGERKLNDRVGVASEGRKVLGVTAPAIA